MIRKHFFAWFLRKGDQINHKIYGQYKSELFKEIAGKVVEIGPGTGVNFEYLPKVIEWIGIEPNELFWSDLKEKAKSKKISAKIEKGDEAKILLPDESADFVIITLVLCSVKNPEIMIGEIKRILKPGGKLIFIEHVAAEKGTKLRFLQGLFNPVCQLLADGCNCTRETWKLLENAGFQKIEISHQKIKGAVSFVSPHIIGFAIK
ncbi:MAG TPA: class I SAM-dependent methyltransferase [Pyrinomonadaceae bacterium]|nr:class I SAM-dependent methyltransferase [Pyrinomonadaceae bacterium]